MLPNEVPPVRVHDDAQARAWLRALDASAERRVTAGSLGSVVWRRWGQGPPLVLLHGGSGSWTHWTHCIEHLAGRFSVLAADLPGLGESPDPPAPYSAQSLAACLCDGINVLLGTSTVLKLVGFSFGGIVAGHIAEHLGARIQRLVIVGSPPFGLGPHSTANAVTAVDPTLTLAAARDQHTRNLRLLMLEHDASVDALALRIHHDNLRRARLRSRKIARTDTLAQALRQTCCPLGGIWGSEDVTIHPSIDAIRELLVSVWPAARVDLMPGVGHWAAHEAPASFRRLLDAQLDLDDAIHCTSTDRAQRVR